MKKALPVEKGDQPAQVLRWASTGDRIIDADTQYQRTRVEGFGVLGYGLRRSGLKSEFYRKPLTWGLSALVGVIGDDCPFEAVAARVSGAGHHGSYCRSMLTITVPALIISSSTAAARLTSMIRPRP